MCSIQPSPFNAPGSSSITAAYYDEGGEVCETSRPFDISSRKLTALWTKRLHQQLVYYLTFRGMSAIHLFSSSSSVFIPNSQSELIHCFSIWPLCMCVVSSWVFSKISCCGESETVQVCIGKIMAKYKQFYFLFN